MGLRILLTSFSTAVLARLLMPEDFGLIAMSSLVTELTNLLGNIGISFVLIQKSRLRRIDLDTAFWIELAMGMGLCLLTVAASFLVDNFFKEPLIRQILWGSSVLFVISGLASIHTTLLRRQLMFKEEVLIQISILVARIGASIVLAGLGWGVWSLVLGSITGQVFGTLTAWYIVPFVPRLRFDRSFLAQYWRSGGSILGSGILNYLMANLDYWVVGRRFGATELGYYQVAFSLPEELRNRLSAPLQRILFPAYSRLQDNNAAFCKGVLKSLRVLSTAVMPIAVGMTALAPDLVYVLYGEKWASVVPLLEILALGGIGRVLLGLINSMFYSRGRPDYVFKIGLFTMPLTAAIIFVGSEWGVRGVAWAMLIVQLPYFLAVRLAMRLNNMPTHLFFRQLMPAAVASAIMYGVLHVATFIPFLALLHPAIRLILLSVMGAIIYFVIIYLIACHIYREILDIVSGLISIRVRRMIVVVSCRIISGLVLVILSGIAIYGMALCGSS